MITKTRLEELIKQGATVYIPDNLWGTIGTLKLRKESYIEYGRVNCDSIKFEDMPSASASYSIPFEDLFETKEDAEFALKYQNITRTETLSLPTWEEFKIVHFIDNLGTHYELEKIRNKICLDFSNDGEFYIKDLIWEATKENYIKACELCRKLFLGENDE